jgi:hypothetical protein
MRDLKTANLQTWGAALLFQYVKKLLLTQVAFYEELEHKSARCRARSS